MFEVDPMTVEITQTVEHLPGVEPGTRGTVIATNGVDHSLVRLADRTEVMVPVGAIRKA